MKVLTNTALVALLAASIGVAGLVPTYAAPVAGAPTQQMMGRHHHFGPHRQGMRGGHPAGFGMTLMRIGCSDRGGEALEIAFVRAKYELKLNATQEPLLEALQTAALADQKSFAATCQTTLGNQGATPPATTLLDRLQAGLTLGQARVAALQDVVPKFKAFYDSLTPEQQAQLNAHAAWRGKGAWMDKAGGADMMAPDAVPPDSTAPAATPGKTATPSST